MFRFHLPRNPPRGGGNIGYRYGVALQRLIASGHPTDHAIRNIDPIPLSQAWRRLVCSVPLYVAMGCSRAVATVNEVSDH